MGQGADERLPDDQRDNEKPDPRNPTEIEDALDDSKKQLRTIFANIYSSKDFRKTFGFSFDADRMGLMNFTSLIKPLMGLGIGGHKKVDRPFDQNGNECESPVSKLFGG